MNRNGTAQVSFVRIGAPTHSFSVSPLRSPSQSSHRKSDIALAEEGLHPTKLRQTAPLRVIAFTQLRRLGHLPRSSECSATIPGKGRCGANHAHLTIEVERDWPLAAKPIVMVSHVWTDGSAGRPDNSANRKFAIVCDGISTLCRKHHLNEGAVHVFIDWFSVDQEVEGTAMFREYMASLPAFVAQMSYVLVPLDSRLLLDDKFRLDEDGNPTPMNWAMYNVRGWCRVEMLIGRALAALGSGVRVYRFDATWPVGRLIEVPPYSHGAPHSESRAESTVGRVTCDGLRL